jgi:hypothetical protein
MGFAQSSRHMARSIDRSILATVQLDLALELFFFAVSVLVRKLPSTVELIPDQCNMTCDPANVIISGVAGNVVVVEVLLL